MTSIRLRRFAPPLPVLFVFFRFLAVLSHSSRTRLQWYFSTLCCLFEDIAHVALLIAKWSIELKEEVNNGLLRAGNGWSLAQSANEPHVSEQELRAKPSTDVIRLLLSQMSEGHIACAIQLLLFSVDIMCKCYVLLETRVPSYPFSPLCLLINETNERSIGNLANLASCISMQLGKACVQRNPSHASVALILHLA